MPVKHKKSHRKPLLQPAKAKALSQPAKKSAKQRYVYYFGDGKADGDGKMKPLLGGKGANLAEMTRINLPVPPGFTITTEVCTYFYENKRSYPAELNAQVEASLAKIEKSTGKKLGDLEKPLLLSVRSGARDSMPGMMDTILNLGMNDAVVEVVATKSGNPRFAWDSYRRFIQMYGDVVMGVQKRAGEDHDPFETVIEGVKHEAGVEKDTDLSPRRPQKNGRPLQSPRQRAHRQILPAGSPRPDVGLHRRCIRLLA